VAAVAPGARAPTRTRARRVTLCAAALTSVALGLTIRTLGDGAWTGPAGDALYAVLIYLLVAILVPGRPRALIAVTAASVCVLIEVFQLSGLPAELAQSWPLIRLVLGTTFGVADLVAYAGGCAVACAADRALSGAARPRRRPESPRHSTTGAEAAVVASGEADSQSPAP
jgi:hypothetical protein